MTDADNTPRLADLVVGKDIIEVSYKSKTPLRPSISYRHVDRDPIYLTKVCKGTYRGTSLHKGLGELILISRDGDLDTSVAIEMSIVEGIRKSVPVTPWVDVELGEI